MRTLASFSKPEQAHLLRAHLEGHGIPAFVRDDHTVTQDWTLSNALGGVRVEVAEGDFDAACALAAECAPPSPTPQRKNAPHSFGRYLKVFAGIFAAVFGLLLWRSYPASLDVTGVLVTVSFTLAACGAGIAALLDL
ncbi:MAG TPA: DUF2007 domain-containing protein [Opitutaceae bacterium]